MLLCFLYNIRHVQYCFEHQDNKCLSTEQTLVVKASHPPLFETHGKPLLDFAEATNPAGWYVCFYLKAESQSTCIYKNYRWMAGN